MPIIQQIPVSIPAPPCPCGEVDKFWYSIIDPQSYGYSDMSGWSINGVDFIIGSNTIMTGLGGSGCAFYDYDIYGTSTQVGYLAYYGKFSSIPQPSIKDPFGNDIFPGWSSFVGSICGNISPGDFQSCVTFELPKADPNIYYLCLSWFDPYLVNTLTGYPNDNGVNQFGISIFDMNGFNPLSMTSPGADIVLKNYLDPFFLNGVNVTLTPTPTHLQITISFIYAMRCGYYENATSKWKEMMLTQSC